MKFFLYTIFFILSVFVIFYIILFLISFKKNPVSYGISFNQNHAESLGLDWKRVYEDMLQDLKPAYVRIAVMWSDVESKKGVYDFSTVDWMMKKAEEYNTDVTLVVGQKAPRWPECHVPSWVSTLSHDEYETRLLDYVDRVVTRYKAHPALELWQVENEPFIRFVFGECEYYRKDLVDKEIQRVKKIDETRFVMVTDSGELSTWIDASHAGDIFGSTLYRVVRTKSGMRIFYDWVPAGWYRFHAWILGIPRERFFIAEMQAEPWFDDNGPLETDIAEQMKTMNIKRLQKHIKYVEHIGVDRNYLWGVEWWYWMKEFQNDSSFWDYIKKVLDRS